MIRTQIQLPESDFAALREAAHRENRSMADCVREAVAAYLTRPRPADRLLACAGKFVAQPPAPPIGDVRDHDRWWADAIMESRRGG